MQQNSVLIFIYFNSTDFNIKVYKTATYQQLIKYEYFILKFTKTIVKMLTKKSINSKTPYI